MTIHKLQGKFWNTFGFTFSALFLKDNYVAISRATNCNFIKTFLKQTASQDQF